MRILFRRTPYAWSSVPISRSATTVPLLLQSQGSPHDPIHSGRIPIISITTGLIGAVIQDSQTAPNRQVIIHYSHGRFRRQYDHHRVATDMLFSFSSPSLGCVTNCCGILKARFRHGVNHPHLLTRCCGLVNIPDACLITLARAKFAPHTQLHVATLWIIRIGSRSAVALWEFVFTFAPPNWSSYIQFL